MRQTGYSHIAWASALAKIVKSEANDRVAISGHQVMKGVLTLGPVSRDAKLIKIRRTSRAGALISEIRRAEVMQSRQTPELLLCC